MGGSRSMSVRNLVVLCLVALVTRLVPVSAKQWRRQVWFAQKDDGEQVPNASDDSARARALPRVDLRPLPRVTRRLTKPFADALAGRGLPAVLEQSPARQWTALDWELDEWGKRITQHMQKASKAAGEEVGEAVVVSAKRSRALDGRSFHYCHMDADALLTPYLTTSPNAPTTAPTTEEVTALAECHEAVSMPVAYFFHHIKHWTPAAAVQQPMQSRDTSNAATASPPSPAAPRADPEASTCLGTTTAGAAGEATDAAKGAGEGAWEEEKEVVKEDTTIVGPLALSTQVWALGPGMLRALLGEEGTVQPFQVSQPVRRGGRRGGGEEMEAEAEEGGKGKSGGGGGAQVVVWAAAEGAVTPSHLDVSHNFLVQVWGVKKVTLFPPSALDSMYLFPWTHPRKHSTQFPPGFPDSSFNKSHIPPSSASSSSSSSSQNVQLLAAYETVLRQGEVLYIPPHWLHKTEVLSSGGAVSVSIWTRCLVSTLFEHLLDTHSVPYPSDQHHKPIPSSSRNAPAVTRPPPRLAYLRRFLRLLLAASPLDSRPTSAAGAGGEGGREGGGGGGGDNSGEFMLAVGTRFFAALVEQRYGCVERRGQADEEEAARLCDAWQEWDWEAGQGGEGGWRQREAAELEGQAALLREILAAGGEARFSMLLSNWVDVLVMRDSRVAAHPAEARPFLLALATPGC